MEADIKSSKEEIQNILITKSNKLYELDHNHHLKLDIKGFYTPTTFFFNLLGEKSPVRI